MLDHSDVLASFMHSVGWGEAQKRSKCSALTNKKAWNKLPRRGDCHVRGGSLLETKKSLKTAKPQEISSKTENRNKSL